MKVITSAQVDNFFKTASNAFSEHFQAGVICDKDGFVISSRFSEKNNHDLCENKLALQAITDKRSILNQSDFIEVKRDLDEAKNIKLLLLLKKENSSKIISGYKELKRIISLQTLF